VPAADLFAGGVGSRIAEQPCLARPLPTTTAAVQPEAPASATRVAAAPKRGGAAVLR